MAGLGAELAILRQRSAFRLAAVAIAMAASAVGCGSASKSAAACPAGIASPPVSTGVMDTPPPVPASGAYLGAFALTGGFSQENFVSSVSDLETEICRPLAIVHSYLRWQHPFPLQSQRSASQAGQALLLSWTGTNMAAMASGADDAEIRTVAADVASLHSPVFIELRWEMDRPNLASVVHSPSTFIAGWDHTRALFAQAGVTNASWVWCPTAAGFDRGTAPAYYPGSAEVDWICTDAYPPAAGPVEQLSTELRSFLAWAEPQGKPIMLGEIGVPQSYSPSVRRDWIADAGRFLEHTPPVKAVVYFDYDAGGHDAGRNYLLAPGSAAAIAFRSLAGDRWFRPTVANR